MGLWDEFKLGKTNQQIVVRTCAVSKLLDSDSSYSSFTIQLENNTQIQVTSGLIASCKDDGCNSSVSLFSNKNLFYKSVLILVCVFLNNIRSHFYWCLFILINILTMNFLYQFLFKNKTFISQLLFVWCLF